MENSRLGGKETDYKKLNISPEPHPSEDGMHLSGREGTFEWWYFDSEFEDGTKTTIVFYTKNRFDADGPAWPTVMMEIGFPGEEQMPFIVREEKNTLIRADRDRCNVSVANSHVERDGDGVYKVHFESPEDQVVFDFTLTPTTPMWRPGDGHCYFGDNDEKFFAWFVAVPSGIAEATITIKGETRKLHGIGYHDHNWANCGMQEILDNWYWCRAIIDGYTVINVDIITAEKYGFNRMPIFLVAKDGKILSDNSVVDVTKKDSQTHEVTGYDIDNRITFHQKSGDTDWTVEYMRERDIVASPPIKGKPNTYVRCVGQVKITKESNGLTEISQDEGLWEQMKFIK